MHIQNIVHMFANKPQHCCYALLATLSSLCRYTKWLGHTGKQQSTYIKLLFLLTVAFPTYQQQQQASCQIVIKILKFRANVIILYLMMRVYIKFYVCVLTCNYFTNFPIYMRAHIYICQPHMPIHISVNAINYNCRNGRVKYSLVCARTIPRV